MQCSLSGAARCRRNEGTRCELNPAFFACLLQALTAQPLPGHIWQMAVRLAQHSIFLSNSLLFWLPTKTTGKTWNQFVVHCKDREGSRTSPVLMHHDQAPTQPAGHLSVLGVLLQRCLKSLHADTDTAGVQQANSVIAMRSTAASIAGVR